jgi:DNA repair exonuclease SbcCD nuclease subunit
LKYLIVGDVHATPRELPDCVALWELVMRTADSQKCDCIILLGDQHDTHDIVNTRVIDFWRDAFYQCAADQIKVVALVGNHDQCTPTIRDPHAMLSYYGLDWVGHHPYICDGISALAYYYNPKEFIDAAINVKDLDPKNEVLFCHQTFVGAEEGLGFKSPDSVDPASVPFKIIISGHIHKPMKIGKVWYPGSPRWRNITDAEVDKRAIWVWEPGNNPIPVLTNDICTRIIKLDDSVENPVDDKLVGLNLDKCDLRVSVFGNIDYITNRITELKTKYNAKCRGVPTRNRLAKVSESEGVDKAFKRFSNNFTPPNGTDKELLLKTVHGRLQ